MNPMDDDRPAPSDEQFDRLVDGELSEAERRDLLSRLDEVPAGWRRCALAFLEAQAWKEALPVVPQEVASDSQPVRTVRRSQFPGGLWGTLVAMAASFALAFGLAPLIRDVWMPAGPGPLQFVDNAKGPAQSDPAEPPAPRGAGDSWQLVTVPVGNGPRGPAGSIQLPAVERERLDEQWLQSFPSAALPEELSEALRRSGHQVRRHRQLLPLPMDGGRQLVVPVDELELRYVGNSAYQ